MIRDLFLENGDQFINSKNKIRSIDKYIIQKFGAFLCKEVARMNRLN